MIVFGCIETAKFTQNQTTYSLIFNVIYNAKFYWTFLDKTESGT